ncbi:MAG: ATP-binding protein [Candidatus Dojkabacteria bacterium]|nr:ATP-binding protein [Candidatus Dojkabacteria bacterium]
MIKSISTFFNKSAIKIGMIVSILFLSFLLTLNFIVLKNSEDSFVNVLRGVRYQVTANPEDRIIEIKPHKYNILQYQPDGTERPKPLQEEFTHDFQESLIKLGAIGILFSFLIGFVVTTILTRPLRKLKGAMQKVREDDYKVKLDKTGTVEIDEVVTEFNKLTEQLERIEDLRKELISDTSHELKTPLTSLQAQLEGIKDGVLKPSDKRVSELLDQVFRLNDLIDRLQEFTRLRNKTGVLNKSSFLLKPLLEKLDKQFKEDLNSKNIKIIINVSDKFSLDADPLMVERAFSNLIRNSIFYSKGRKIEITARGSLIKFKDDGNGVDEEKLLFLFERFYRVEKSRNRSTGGLGLGLSIVKEIVVAHSWKIEVLNQNGLLFRIRTSSRD